MKNFLLAAIAAAVLLIAGCSDDNPVTPVAAQQFPAFKAGEGFVAGAKVTVYSDDSLRTGYNKLYFLLTDSATGKPLTDAHVMMMPMMYMTTMNHSAPYWQIADTTSNGLFSGAAVFQMPSNAMEGWKLQMTVHNHPANREEMKEIPVNVLASDKSITLTGSDSAKYVIAMVAPVKPAVGFNEISFTLHKRANMMSFPPVENFTMEMVPEMPSMGHGSPNNINPAHTSGGVYKGKVNFTMTGEWKLNITIRNGSTTIAASAFWVRF